MSIEVDAIVYKQANNEPLDEAEKATLKSWEDRLDSERNIYQAGGSALSALEDTRRTVISDYARKLA
jgi:hypothetical protein